MRRPTALVLSCFAAFAACTGGMKRKHDVRPDGATDARVEGAREDAALAQEDASHVWPDGGAMTMEGGGSMTDAGERRDASQDGAAADAGRALPEHTYVYVGGYSDSDGLRVYALNRATFALSPIAHTADVGPQPSYITPSADGRILYVANESDEKPGITVLRVDAATGAPTRIDHEGAISSSFVFSALTPDGKYLLAASYNGGNVAVYPVKSDGSLDPRVDERSFGASAQSHCVRVHRSGRWAYVPNKGLDSLAQLLFDPASGKLSDNTPPTFAAQPAATAFNGPRHLAFSPDGKLAFVVLELGDALFSLAVKSDGTLIEVDRKARIPANAAVTDTGAHVLAHPTQRFVYASNRGTNTLAASSYDTQGKLTLIGHVPSRGRTPRNFDIDPLGRLLIVANQEAESGSGGSLAVFAIESDGRLTPKGGVIDGLSSPAAVAIVPH